MFFSWWFQSRLQQIVCGKGLKQHYFKTRRALTRTFNPIVVSSNPSSAIIISVVWRQLLWQASFVSTYVLHVSVDAQKQASCWESLLCGVLVWEWQKRKGRWTGRRDMAEKLLKSALKPTSIHQSIFLYFKWVPRTQAGNWSFPQTCFSFGEFIKTVFLFHLCI